jgi:2-oxo-4-hydroxy-4-carboxy-5-ureidoimidazoline decarboxylase
MAAPAGLAWFNALPHDEAVAALLECCAAPGWAARVASGRPYPSTGDFVAAAGAAWRERADGDLDAAMSAHPRIGEAAGGRSRAEQAAVGSGPQVLAALREANAAYERRFGHVFMICATGLGAEQILAELRRRLGNDPAAEREAAAAEIAKINALRLRKLAEGPGGGQAPGEAPAAGISTHVLDTARGRPAAGVPVSLAVWEDGGWRSLGESVTNSDGRARDLPGPIGDQPCTCRLTFGVRAYLLAEHGTAFFPEVTVVFTAGHGQHYHVPLLLAPFGYSVYRGS